MKNLFILLFILFQATWYYAQEKNPTVEKKDNTKHRSPLKLMPYYNYNRALGNEFGLMPMLSFSVHKKDTLSPKSMLGLLGYYTANKSYALGTFGQLFIKEDKWRILYSLGYGLYNFQTYYQIPGQSEGTFIDYGTQFFGAGLDVRRRVYKNIFLGLGFLFQDSKSNFASTIPEQKVNLKILNFEFFRDNRSSVYYPRNGSLIYLQFRLLPTWIGNADNSNTLILNFNQFYSSRNNTDVIALRAHTKAGLSKLAFQQQPVIGGQDLRGYSLGKYRGDGVIDIQGEYRFNFSNTSHWGLVGFAGLATLYGSDVPEFNWKAYYSIGAGFRYFIDLSSRMDIGLDIAKGKGDWSVNFQLNEAF